MNIPTKEIFDKFEKVIVDLGCGDGKQVYRLASKNPHNYYIGIDANSSLFEEIEKKVKKKPSKGGLENLTYLQYRAEELPEELHNLVDEVQINFPWGSLLEGIVKAETAILEPISKILKNEAQLHITLTYDDKYEETYRAERGMPDLSLEFINSELEEKYREFGFLPFYSYILLDVEKQHIDSPWGKKILSKRDREVYKLQFILKK